MGEIKNRSKLNDCDVAHLEMNQAFSTKGFQALLDWQKADGVYCSTCRAIALKIGMKPSGGWISEMPSDKWHRTAKHLMFGGADG